MDSNSISMVTGSQAGPSTHQTNNITSRTTQATTTQSSTPQSNAIEPTTPQSSVGQASTIQSSTNRVSISQVNTQSNITSADTVQTNTSQSNTPQASTPHASTPQSSTDQVNTTEASTIQTNTPQTNTTPNNSSQVNTPQTDTTQPSTPKTNTPQACTPEACTPACRQANIQARLASPNQSLNPNTTNNSTLPWFTLPAEVRNKIYHYLAQGTHFNVNAIATPTVYFFTTQLQNSTTFYNHVLGPLPANNNFLTISKRFYREARAVIWGTAKVRFERRWDFCIAHSNGSLLVDPGFGRAPTGYETICMYPLASDVFQRISDLRINLTEDSDFGGRVTCEEAKRVTSNILSIIHRSMPALRILTMIVDQKARIHGQHLLFLPYPWFLQALLAIRHLTAIRFRAGGNFSGYGKVREVQQTFVRVLNVVLEEHLAVTVESERLDRGIRNEKGVQWKVGTKVLAKVTSGDVRYGVTAKAVSQLTALVNSVAGN